MHPESISPINQRLPEGCDPLRRQTVILWILLSVLIIRAAVGAAIALRAGPRAWRFNSRPGRKSRRDGSI